MLCQPEFKGIQSKDPYDREAKYSYLVLAFDQFEGPVRWSLRNSRICQNLGFPKEVCNIKYFADLVRSDGKL